MEIHTVAMVIGQPDSGHAAVFYSPHSYNWACQLCHGSLASFFFDEKFQTLDQAYFQSNLILTLKLYS